MLQHLHIYAQGLNRHPARYLRGTADPAPYPFSVACLGCNGKPSPGPDGVHSAMAFNQKDGDVKPGLQFVIDGPCLNNDKAKIRTLVRSNASRYYWRERQQTRARTAVTKKGKNAENSRPMNLSSESLNRATPNLPPKNDESFTAILQTTGRYPQLSFNFNPRDTTADAPLDEEMPNQYFGWRWSHQEGYPGALSLLGAGKVDPFWSYPSALPRSVVGELMTYGEW